MISFTARIQKFNKKGEKSGWRYIEITAQQAHKLKPDCKQSFRVKGLLDHHPIYKIALLPMGNGDFIIPFNNTFRKATGKREGDVVNVKLEYDGDPIQLSKDFVACLKDDAKAYAFFMSLPKGHQNYFSKWIESAKTETTKTKRIAMAVIALHDGQGYGEMIRANKSNR